MQPGSRPAYLHAPHEASLHLGPNGAALQMKGTTRRLRDVAVAHTLLV
jgi:hypothetical protein